MPDPRQWIIDTWSGLSHKAALRVTGVAAPSMAPSWVGSKHARRLDAYKILDAYLSNAGRLLLTDDPKAMKERREYGDPELVVQTIRAAVLGGTPRPLVEGADGEPPAEPTDEDVVDGGPTLPELVAEWEIEKARIAAAVERQEWFDSAFDAERGSQKIIGGEDNAVGLGDAVYWLTWSNAKQRVRVRTYNPGFYFPSWSDEDEDFPDRVHLAWEFEDDDGKRFVRRITHQRVMVAARSLPYQDELSEWTVTITDATWPLEGIRSKHVHDFDFARATFNRNADGVELRDFDLGIDFIPIVHVPNTIPRDEAEPWGKSALLRIAQILDDLAENDTDTAITARLVASPPLTQSADVPMAGKVQSYGPGMILAGDVKLIDTSKSLTALLERNAQLLERLSINRQLPGSILGRVDQSQIKSGLHLMLTFGPFRSMIEDYRLVRTEKFGLFCKFWQRLAVVGGELEDVLPANLAFGPFLPNDLEAVKAMVVDLVKAHVMSRGTALRLLQEAGLDIESIDDELDAARAEDYEGALTVANAVNNDAAAAEMLDIDLEALKPAATPAPPQPPPFPPPGPANQPPPAPPVNEPPA